MKLNNRYFSLTAAIITLLFSACIFAPYYAIYYDNKELPRGSEGDWDLGGEQWFMRFVIQYGHDSDWNWKESGLFKSKNIEKRNREVINKYYIGEALCYAGIIAENQTTTSSSNPYRICIWVYGMPGKHTSFTVNKITVRSRSGSDLSHLANNELPKTVMLESETTPEQKEFFIVRGYYASDSLFNFKNEPVHIKITLNINGIDAEETGTVAYVLEPVKEYGLFQGITR